MCMDLSLFFKSCYLKLIETCNLMRTPLNRQEWEEFNGVEFV